MAHFFIKFLDAQFKTTMLWTDLTLSQ